VERLKENLKFRAKTAPNSPLLFSARRPKLAHGDDLLQRDCLRVLATMHQPELYSIQEARKLLGGISRNTIYQLLRSGDLASVVIGCRRFISAAAIAELITRSTTTVSPARASTRSRKRGQSALPLPLPPAPRGRGQRAQN
jgi:excisionase family DNA binding protein